jgi:hypothetical protein
MSSTRIGFFIPRQRRDVTLPMQRRELGIQILGVEIACPCVTPPRRGIPARDEILLEAQQAEEDGMLCH